MRALSRFFVSVTDDTGAINPMGVNAANLESAIDQAVSLARQLRETGEENGDDRSNWTLGIGSESGDLLWEMTLAEIFAARAG